MNDHPVLKKQKLEKEVEKCIYKVILEKNSLLYRKEDNCLKCKGYKIKCPDYIPKSTFKPDAYMDKLRESGM